MLPGGNVSGQAQVPRGLSHDSQVRQDLFRLCHDEQSNPARLGETLLDRMLIRIVPFHSVRLSWTNSPEGALLCSRWGSTAWPCRKLATGEAPLCVCLSRFAFMYAKTVTLGGTHWEQTNEILFRNRRIGCRYAFFADPSPMCSLFVPLPRRSSVRCSCPGSSVYSQPCGNIAALLPCTVGIEPADLAKSRLLPPLIRTRFGSMSGLAQFVAARGLGTLREWCEEGYKAVARIDEDLSGEMRRVMHRPMQQ